MNSYKEFMDDVRNTDRFYTTREWEGHDVQQKHWMKDCYPLIEPTLTVEENQEIWSETIQYYLFRYKGKVQTIFDTSIPEFAELQQKMKEIWPNPYEAFEQIFKSYSGRPFEEIIKEMVRTDSLNAE